MADYREHYQAIRAAGANLVAISVDPPQKSDALRKDLRLPFPILSDTNRSVIQEWDIYNPRERGGIAKPAVFIIERDRTVRYSALDTVSSRVPAGEIVRVLHAPKPGTVRRKLYVPSFAEWFCAIRNSIRK